jgi:hypothetical protein
MTEPILSSSDLKPLFSVVFARRFRIVGILVGATLACYCVLLLLKLASYESVSVVMVKVPVIDFEFRVDPNPQVAPAYVDLAQADALLFNTHSLAVEMRSLAEPVAKEYGIPEEVSFKERDIFLKKLRRDTDLPNKLEAAGAKLSVNWQRDFFVQPEFFLGLFEIDQETLDQIPLYTMQEAFTVKTNIAQQTNINLVNQPFLNFKVRWGSPGAAAVFANIWSRLFVDRANDLAVEMGYNTEESVLRESTKIGKEVEAFRKKLADLQTRPEYQKMLKVEGLENSLYGSRSRLDMFGYVELHADIALQSGLVGELSKLEVEKAKAEGEAEAPKLASQVASVSKQIEELTAHAQAMRGEISAFNAEYHQIQFEIDQRNRLMAERLTTAMYSTTRFKSGYAIPPMSFVERAIPSKHPTGPPRSILSLVFGVLCAMLYTSWVIYRQYLVPAVAAM